MLAEYCCVCVCVCVLYMQENDAESLRAKVRKLQAEVADSEDTISTLEAQVRKQRTGTVSAGKRAPAKVRSAVCGGGWEVLVEVLVCGYPYMRVYACEGVDVVRL